MSPFNTTAIATRAKIFLMSFQTGFRLATIHETNALNKICHQPAKS